MEARAGLHHLGKRAFEAVRAKLPTVEFLETQKRNRFLEGWIGSGMELMKGESWEEANSHFINKQAAEKAGFSDVELYAYTLVRQEPEEEMLKMAGVAIWRGSKLGGLPFSGYNDEDIWAGRFKNTSLSLSLPVIINVHPETQRVYPAVYQWLALCQAEEWIHGFQVKRAKPLAGFRDMEVDVAAYLLDNGVKLNEPFLREYNRAHHLAIYQPKGKR